MRRAKDILQNCCKKNWRIKATKLPISISIPLQRAIQRNVEKLDQVRLIHDYETYYHAAQRLHFKKDEPQNAADVIFYNDLVLPKSLTDE